MTKKNLSIDTIGYRTKSEGRMCALILSVPLLELMGNPQRVDVVVQPRMGPNVWRMIISPYASGYAVNFKRKGSTGEVNVAWSKLHTAPADASGKGILPCHWRPAAQELVVDINTWKEETKPQDTLFGDHGVRVRP